MSLTKELVKQIAEVAIETPKKILKKAPEIAVGVGFAAAGALGMHVVDKIDADKRIKKEKIKSFEHGV